MKCNEEKIIFIFQTQNKFSFSANKIYFIAIMYFRVFIKNTKKFFQLFVNLFGLFLFNFLRSNLV